MNPIYFNPKDGQENFEKPGEYTALIKSLPEKRHIMTIKKYSGKRSLDVNAYYWSIVIPYFMAEMGLVDSKTNREYIHYTVLGDELRRVPDDLRPGKTKLLPTHTMTGSEFWKYIHKCELLFHQFFNGSFPPPKGLGYDVSKK